MNEQAHLKVQAGSNAVALRVGGIPGIPHGAKITLSLDDGSFSATVPKELYPWLSECEPGSFVFVVFGIVRPFIEAEPILPEGLTLPPRGLIRPN